MNPARPTAATHATIVQLSRTICKRLLCRISRIVAGFLTFCNNFLMYGHKYYYLFFERLIDYDTIFLNSKYTKPQNICVWCGCE